MQEYKDATDTRAGWDLWATSEKAVCRWIMETYRDGGVMPRLAQPINLPELKKRYRGRA